MAIGLLYYHFTDKRGLYAAGLETLAEQMRASIRHAVADPAQSSPLEHLLASLKAELEFVEKHPTIYHELNGNASLPKIKSIIDRNHEERLELVRKALPHDVRMTAAVKATIEGWLHFVEGVEIAWLQKRKLTAEQICKLCCHVLFASVRAAGEFARNGTGQ